MSDNLQGYLTKSLSFLLRHNSGPAKIAIDAGGFASLEETVAAINSNPKMKGMIDAGAVANAVAQDEKDRFEIVESPEGIRIRALSGHSFPVEIPGEDLVPVGSLWFGTSMDAYDRIAEFGLSATTKLKARLRSTREEAERISAARKGGPLLVEVDAVRLHSEGHRFSRLSNGEIVTDPFGSAFCTLHPSSQHALGL